MDKRDNKNRILNRGESQRKDGRYCFTYNDTEGKRISVYSWKLVETDRVPKGKQDGKALRTLEAEIQKTLSKGISVSGGNITVRELAEKYLETKTESIKPQTLRQYKSNIKLLNIKSFGNRKIKSVTAMDAEGFLIYLHKQGYKSGTIGNLKRILTPCFAKAVRSKIIESNPFDFTLKGIIRKDSQARESITEEQQSDFLDFIRCSKCYNKHYDTVFILFNTGLRVSELCGLTVKDIDFTKKTVSVNKQLTPCKRISTPKSESGYRDIPLSESVCKAFERIINQNSKYKIQPIIDGVGGFIFRTNTGNVVTSTLIQRWFSNIVSAYNKERGESLVITPHTCRHTYCSNLIKSGVNPKTVQYLLGHSDVTLTLNVYTHTDIATVKEDMLKFNVI